MQRRDHHDWASETYVDEWVRRGERFETHYSDLSQTGSLPKQFAPFDAVVSSLCLHNLRAFTHQPGLS